MSTDNKIRFAVFGDIHGRFTLMYTLVYLYEQKNNLTIDAILQLGDMGAFPDLSRLDNATLKFAKHDTDELGFQNYVNYSNEAEKVLRCCHYKKSYLIAGNHEDFDYLNQFKTPGTLDPWNCLIYIPDGQTLNLNLAQGKLTLAGFGKIHPRHESANKGKKSRKSYRQSQKTAQLDPRFFTEQEIDKAFIDTPVDILMTHAGPRCKHLQTGSTYLHNLTSRIKPSVHLFGHHHKAIGPTSGPGSNLLIGLDHLEFKNDNLLKDGSWGILTIEQNAASFEFCSSENQSWLINLSRENYRQFIL